MDIADTSRQTLHLALFVMRIRLNIENDVFFYFLVKASMPRCTLRPGLGLYLRSRSPSNLSRRTPPWPFVCPASPCPCGAIRSHSRIRAHSERRRVPHRAARTSSVDHSPIGKEHMYISQAKSNYWALKYDTNGRSCELEHQSTLKNEGRTVASYLAADVCKPNLKGISQAKSNYWASKYDTNGRNCGWERQFTYKNEGSTATSYQAPQVFRTTGKESPYVALDLDLNIIDGIGWLDLEDDVFAGEGLNEDLWKKKNKIFRLSRWGFAHSHMMSPQQ